MITDCKLKTTFLLTMAAVSVFAEPTVTDVVAKQRFPWNGLVDITCKVTGIGGTAQKLFDVAAVMPDTGNVRNASHYWVVQNGTKSTDLAVRTNGTYRLVWDASADLGQVTYDNMVVRVYLDAHDGIQLWEGGPYWATTNIGAENPEDYGYYFWWGDTIGYKRENNAWVATDGSSSNFSFNEANTPTYNNSIGALKRGGWITADEVLAPEHDAAHVHWDGSWRMPTYAEISALIANCTTEWITTNGVSGRLITGKGAYADRSIFLPAAGRGTGSSLLGTGSAVDFWSSTPDSYHSPHAWALTFYSSYFDWDTTLRYGGQSVRPVRGFAE